MKPSLILLALAISGCATTANYEKILNSWVGADADRLVESWGSPEQEYKFNSGGKLLTFSRVGGTSSYTTYDPYLKMSMTSTSTNWCKTTFMVDSQNSIRQWKWEGNSCKAKNPDKN